MLTPEPSYPVADGSKLAWQAPAVGELTPDQAAAEGLITQDEALALGPQVPGIGHNQPPAHKSDPGPDRTYEITFSIPDYVSRDSVRRFSALCGSKADIAVGSPPSMRPPIESGPLAPSRPELTVFTTPSWMRRGVAIAAACWIWTRSPTWPASMIAPSPRR